MNRDEISKIAKGGGRADEALIAEIKSFSMLHHETPRILRELEALSR